MGGQERGGEAEDGYRRKKREGERREVKVGTRVGNNVKNLL